MFYSEAASKRCSTKISVLQKLVQELAFLHLWSKTLKNTCGVKEFIFSKVAGLHSATLRES